MVKIIIVSPSGKSRFAYEFLEVRDAQKLLDVFRFEGYEAAERHVKMLGNNVCRICGRIKSSHVPGGHPFRPFTNVTL
jgi:hypothetical protein